MQPEEPNTQEPEAPEAPQEPVAEEPVAAEEPATPEPQAPESEPEVQGQPSEDIDINQYAQERYQAPVAQDNRNSVEQVTQELSQLPTDEYGTVDSNAAAEWFARKLSEVGNQAEQRAVQRAEEIFYGNMSETNQQRAVIDKYPEAKKDRALMEDIFDKRDAAALRGQNLSLIEAADRVMGRSKQARTEGAQGAQRRTVVQAAAHLETASSRGSTTSQPADFSDKETRQAALRQFVQNGIESGEIQIPGK